MLPVSLSSEGEKLIVKRITGTPQTKHHLENLGFVPGSEILIVSKNTGNLIVKIRDTRIALGQEMAARIFV